MANENLVMGFDLGGTKMLAAVMSEDDRILGRSKQRTMSQEEPEEIYARIVATIRGALADAGKEAGDILGIGIGSPGPLDLDKGKILDTPNLNLRQFPLKARLEEEFGFKVLLDNDVNVGTYGEYRFGAGKGFRHVVGIFPGTGIGGGLVLDGKLFHGATGAAGEVGHMIVQMGGPLCGCGQYGCLEAVASKTSMAKDMVMLASNGLAPTVLGDGGTDMKRITSKTFRKAIKANEQPVIRLVDRAAEMLGVGMANCVNLLSPEIIVLGGGLIEKLGRSYLQVAEASMRRHAMPFLVEKVKVKAAVLGDDAVILGGAALLRESLGLGGTP